MSACKLDPALKLSRDLTVLLGFQEVGRQTGSNANKGSTIRSILYSIQLRDVWGQLLGSNVKAQCIMGVCLDSFMAVSKNTSFYLSLPFSCHKYPPQLLHHAAISIQQTTELTWVRNV